MGQPFRLLIEWAVCLLIGMQLVTAWIVKPFVVPTGSMAPVLVGLHRDTTCGECGFRYACGTDWPPVAGQRVACPNCGYDQQPLSSGPDLTGDRVLVDRSAFEHRTPRRWEVIAFQSRQVSDEVAAKRVVGLPGESVQIREGDVYINGQISRKSLTEQLAMAVLVHDANYEPRSKNPLGPRWRGEPGQTRWQAAGGRFICQPLSSRSQREVGPTVDWLTYHHVRRQPGASKLAEETPIFDWYAYNQTHSVVESFAVPDVLLSCDFRIAGTGQVLLLAADGENEFLARMDATEKKAELIAGGRVVEQQADCALSTSTNRLVWSLVDRACLLALNGRTIFAYPFERSKDAMSPSAKPLAIGSAGLQLEVTNLRVYRDVYYRRLRGNAATAGIDEPLRLAAGEYYVLGDNSPQSADSRLLSSGPAVHSEQLVGKPFWVYFPTRPWPWAGLGFQVPDISRIRYIH
jgi:signal peptidase I